MATDIKSVNTKLICNGEDLSKKLQDGQGEIESFAKAASKEITVPVGTKSTESQKQSGAGVQSGESFSSTGGFGGGLSFIRGAGQELFSQFKEMDLSKPMEWSKVVDVSVHTISAGLNQLGPKGIAAAVALETVHAAGTKIGEWIGDNWSPIAKVQDDPKFNEFMRNRDMAEQNIDGLIKSQQRAIATRGMSPGQASLWDIENSLSEKNIKPTDNMKFRLGVARDKILENDQKEAAAQMKEAGKRASEQQQQQMEMNAKSFVEGLGGPAGKARGEFRNMTNLLNAGLINPRQFGEGALNTIEGLERQLGLGGRGRALAGASDANSVDGVNAILTAQNIDGPKSMEDRLQDIKTAVDKQGADQVKKVDELLKLFQNRPGLVAGLVQ